MFHCRVCRQKDREIERLYRLIDNLLLKIDISPVDNRELQENWTKGEKSEDDEEVVG